jgi:molybdate transport system substrate-binding protein
MNRTFHRAVRAFAVVLLAVCSGTALADEVRVLAAGAAKHALEEISAEFQRATGHTLNSSFDTVGAQRDRVLQSPAGGAADVVVLSDAALLQLRDAGRLLPAAPVKIGRVVVALAVPAQASVPDLSTPEALRQALLAAPSIACADPARGATAGTHFAKVLEALGLQDAVRAKTTVLPFGVDVIRAVAAGRFALGVSQSSEILQHAGIRYAGALPPPHSLSTGYGAALAADSAAARVLLAFLARPETLKRFRASGFVTAP